MDRAKDPQEEIGHDHPSCRSGAAAGRAHERALGGRALLASCFWRYIARSAASTRASTVASRSRRPPPRQSGQPLACGERAASDTLREAPRIARRGQDGRPCKEHRELVAADPRDEDPSRARPPGGHRPTFTSASFAGRHGRASSLSALRPFASRIATESGCPSWRRSSALARSKKLLAFRKPGERVGAAAVFAAWCSYCDRTAAAT